MRASILFRMMDFYLALAVFVLSTGGAWVALDHTRAESLRANLVENPLIIGTQSFKVLSYNECVGGLSVSLERLEGEMNLVLRGSLRTIARNKAVPFLLEADLGFNMLGQLGGGLIKLSSPEARFAVGLEEINPITVTLISSLLGGDGRKKIKIPGPLELAQHSRNSYQLRYAPLALQAIPVQGALQQYSSVLDLKVESLRVGEKGCESPKEGVPVEDTEQKMLNLDSVADILEKQLQLFSRFLPQELLLGQGSGS